MILRPWKALNGQKIEKLYAWVGAEDDGGEGILASMLPGMPGITPLIGADKARIESYRPIAMLMAHSMGRKVRLKVFGAGAVIDEVGEDA